MAFVQLEKNVEMFSGPKKCRTAALGIATDMKFEAKCHDPPKVPIRGCPLITSIFALNRADPPYVQ